jgi:hypothetical protein
LAAKYFERGQLLHQQKKLPEAETALREAIRLDPGHEWAHHH